MPGTTSALNSALPRRWIASMRSNSAIGCSWNGRTCCAMMPALLISTVTGPSAAATLPWAARAAASSATSPCGDRGAHAVLGRERRGHAEAGRRVEIDDADVGAGGRERVRGRAPDAGPAAGDQRAAAGQRSRGHCCVLLGKVGAAMRERDDRPQDRAGGVEILVENAEVVEARQDAAGRREPVPAQMRGVELGLALP